MKTYRRCKRPAEQKHAILSDNGKGKIKYDRFVEKIKGIRDLIFDVDLKFITYYGEFFLITDQKGNILSFRESSPAHNFKLFYKKIIKEAKKKNLQVFMTRIICTNCHIIGAVHMRNAHHNKDINKDCEYCSMVSQDLSEAESLYSKQKTPFLSFIKKYNCMTTWEQR